MLKSLKVLLDDFDRLNRRRHLIVQGDRVLTAVSGGPDSTALLEILCVLRRKFSLKVFAAHLNHGLYPKQATAHERLVRSACERLGVPIDVRHVSVRAAAKNSRRSIEETAREERYAFFTAAASRFGAGKIATAHTLDDQAETVLLRAIRGSGLRGLGGIPASRPLGKRLVVRPLIRSTKKNILSFLAAEKIAFGADASNDSDDFTRNRVRKELLPLLAKKYNPRIAESLAALAEASADAGSFVDSAAAAAFKKTTARNKKGVALDLGRWAALEPAIRAEVLFLAVEAIQGDRKGYSRAHLDEMVRIAESRQTDLAAVLPAGLRVKRAGRTLHFLS